MYIITWETRHMFILTGLLLLFKRSPLFKLFRIFVFKYSRRYSGSSLGFRAGSFLAKSTQKTSQLNYYQHHSTEFK